VKLLCCVWDFISYFWTFAKTVMRFGFPYKDEKFVGYCGAIRSKTLLNWFNLLTALFSFHSLYILLPLYLSSCSCYSLYYDCYFYFSLFILAHIYITVKFLVSKVRTAFLLYTLFLYNVLRTRDSRQFLHLILLLTSAFRTTRLK
jgi:hypothetical protein